MASLRTSTGRTGPPVQTIQWLLVGLMVALGINCYSGVQSVGQLSGAYDRLVVTRNDLGFLRSLQASIVDAETGVRGYLLTQDEAYLEPYRLTVAGLDIALVKGQERFSDDEALAAEYQSVQAVTRRKEGHLERIVALAETKGFAAATKLLRQDVGLDHMQELRDEIDAMEFALGERLGTTRDRVDADRDQVLRSLVGGVLVSVALIGLVMVLYRKTMKGEVAHRQALFEANESLEQQIDDRTRTLRSANAQLKSANEDLESFTYAVSHDLQEPLRKIQAFGDRLRSDAGTGLGDTSHDYLNRMQNAASRMSSLLSDLLSFSRVSTRGIDPVEVDLALLVRNVVSNLEIAIEESSANVSVGKLPSIRGDVSQLTQLLQNLLSNALKFKTPDGVPQITVSALTEKSAQLAGGATENTVAISVEDNGIGFDERYLDRIFTPFQRLHSRDEYAGSGIGLAICRKVCERHGGVLEAVSSPGEGATFIARLPIAGPPKGVGQPPIENDAITETQTN